MYKEWRRVNRIYLRLFLYSTVRLSRLDLTAIQYIVMSRVNTDISGGVCSRFVETRGRPSALLVDLAYPFLILEEYHYYASRHARPKRSDDCDDDRHIYTKKIIGVVRYAAFASGYITRPHKRMLAMA
ncbi:uncharacterized protein LOC141536259 [Cotesia typhae]|uniref:uncharacterized protein LOC141536259 n=1 Tax=Cotesia typhae TaxID=2053667 RepID=UPI003D68D9BE